MLAVILSVGLVLCEGESTEYMHVKHVVTCSLQVQGGKRCNMYIDALVQCCVFPFCLLSVAVSTSIKLCGGRERGNIRVLN